MESSKPRENTGKAQAKETISIKNESEGETVAAEGSIADYDDSKSEGTVDYELDNDWTPYLRSDSDVLRSLPSSVGIISSYVNTSSTITSSAAASFATKIELVEMVAAELGTKRNDRTLCNLASTCKAWKQLAEKSLELAKEKYRAVCGDELAGMTDARRDLVRFVYSKIDPWWCDPSHWDYNHSAQIFSFSEPYACDDLFTAHPSVWSSVTKLYIKDLSLFGELEHWDVPDNLKFNELRNLFIRYPPRDGPAGYPDSETAKRPLPFPTPEQCPKLESVHIKFEGVHVRKDDYGDVTPSLHIYKADALRLQKTYSAVPLLMITSPNNRHWTCPVRFGVRAIYVDPTTMKEVKRVTLACDPDADEVLKTVRGKFLAFETVLSWLAPTDLILSAIDMRFRGRYDSFGLTRDGNHFATIGFEIIAKFFGGDHPVFKGRHLGQAPGPASSSVSAIESKKPSLRITLKEYAADRPNCEEDLAEDESRRQNVWTWKGSMIAGKIKTKKMIFGEPDAEEDVKDQGDEEDESE